MRELIDGLRKLPHIGAVIDAGSFKGIAGLYSARISLTAPHPLDKIKRVAARHGFEAKDQNIGGTEWLEITHRNNRDLTINCLPIQCEACQLATLAAILKLLGREVLTKQRGLN